jgi:flagellum-specific peptidoglycan hydrolase FlgJ
VQPVRSRAGVNQGATTAAPPPQGPSPATSSSPRPRQPAPQPSVPSQQAAPQQSAPRTANQRDFIQQYSGIAQQVAEQTGIPYQVLLGVSANETGWGKAAKGNNFFGIKGKNPQTGQSFQAGTWEEVNGQHQDTTAEFRAYDSALGSFQDFADFIHSNPRYQPALDYLQSNPNDWRGFVHMLQDEGYATSSTWADQVVSIGNEFDNSDVQPSPLSQGQGGVSSVLDVGSTAIGSKYQWGGAGGRSDFGDQLANTDCSGFVSWAYEKATGIRLPAQTSAIYASTTAVRPEDAQPGDLIEFGMNQNDPAEQHVAIYAGNGMMLHDSSVNPNGGVDLTPVWSGGEFRRVPGVDPSLRTSGDQQQQGPKIGADDQWFISSQGGRQVYQGVTADGQGYTYDMGPTSAPENTVLGGSFQQGQQQGGGNEVGAGQEGVEPDTGEADWSFLDTRLNPSDEMAYQRWKQYFAPQDSGEDYDLRGAFLAGVTPDTQTGHWPDTYKKPNHPTFSDQSKFAKRYPERAGHWNGDTYQRPGAGQEDGENDPNSPTPDPRVAPVVVQELHELNDPNNPPDPRVAAVRQQEIHEAVDPTPADTGSAPGPDTAQAMTQQQDIHEAVDTTGQTAAPAPTSGKALAGEFAMTRPLGAAPPVTSDTPAAPVSTPSMGTTRHIAPTPQPPPPKVDVPPLQPLPPASTTVESSGIAKPTADTPITRLNAAGRAAATAGEQTAPAAQEAAQAVTTSFAHTASMVPGFISKTVIPAAEAAGNLASQVTPYLSSGTAAQKLLPGVQSSLDYLSRNGVDIQSHVDKLAKPEPGSLSERVAKGDTLSLGDQVALGMEVLNKYNDFRSGVIRDMQAPEVRDTPEGQAFNWGATLVSDPLNMVGLPELGTGRVLMEGGELGARSLAAGEQAIRTDVGREFAGAVASRPANVSLDAAQYYTRLAQPYNAEETRMALGRAALDLNDPVLDAQVRSMPAPVLKYNWQTQSYTSATKYEPLTGRQLRDTVIRAVARQNPEMRGQQILDETDKLLTRAGRPELTTPVMTQTPGYAFTRRALTNARLRMHEFLAPAERAAQLAEDAHGNFWENAQQILGANISGRGTTPGSLLPSIEESFYKPRPESGLLTTGRALTGAVTGAAAFTKAYASTDPNDPNRWLKVGAATAGGSLAGIGMAWGAGMLWRGLNGNSANLVTKIFQPMEGLSAPARELGTRWAGEYNAAGQLSDLFESQTRAVFGRSMDDSMMIQIEETGQLPREWQNNPSAQDWLNKWRQITAWAVQHDIVHNERSFLDPSGPAMYVPHAVADDYQVAVKLAGEEERRGSLAMNPFDHYNQQRVYPTLREGMQNGVQYAQDWPKVLSNYVATALRRRANENFVQGLVERAAQNNPDLLGPNIKPLILKGEDILQLGESGYGRPANGRRLSEVIPGNQFANRDIYVSSQLGTVLHNVFGSQSPFKQLPPLSRALDFNAQFKHNVLSGSLFHLGNEVRQLFATQGGKGFENAWTMLHEMTTPGGARAFWRRPENRAGSVQALRDGLNLNLSTDRDVALSWYNRLTSGAVNVAGGAVAGYSGASAAGMSDEDKRNWALAGALLGLGMSVPLGIKPESQSLVQHFSQALWERYIPFMKYTTYQMYAPGFGGQEAAKFVNNVYGGQNLLAMARHPFVQDIAKLALLAPDWQEGWIRQVGSAAFDWHGPQGQMNRIYWRNAALQSAFALEGMNQALGGKWSWENDPDATLMVNMTRFYDLMGWKHYDTYGKPYTPYLDILGPYRAMLQPIVETARAATVGLAQAAGVDPSRLPKEVTGQFGTIPEPDPGTAWKNFASSRIGFLPATIGEMTSGRDFAGRPLDRPSDPWYQVAANRVDRGLQHMLPTGESQIVQSGTRGDPLAIAVLGGLTGMRTLHEPDSYFKFQDQFIRDTGHTLDEWQDRHQAALDTNAAIDKKIELLQNGQVNNNGSYAQPGESDMTGQQRNDKIKELIGQRQNTREQLDSLIPQDASPEEQQRLRAQIQWLDDKQTTAGTDAPADLVGRPDLDPNELYRLAWNRYPEQISQIKGTQPEPTDFGQTLTQKVLPHLTAGGQSADKQVANLRDRWVTDTAMQWDVDPAVMQDIVKAKLYGEDLPPLPGVTSAQLDQMTTEYEHLSAGEGGNSLAATEVVRKRQEWVAEQAQQHGLDPAALQERIKLRTLPMADQSPGALQRSHAITALANSRTAAFTNPDGSPMGSPHEWQDWNAKLDQHADRYDKQSGIYVKHLPNGHVVPDPDLNTYAAGKAQANADRMKDVLNGPYASDYERLYGKGAAMTDKQWQQYQAGTLPGEWNDPGGTVPPTESQQRHKALLIWSALTPQERIDYSDPKKWNQQMTWLGTDWQHGGKTMTVRHTTLTEYVRYINQWQSAHWKGQGLGAPDAPDASP